MDERRVDWIARRLAGGGTRRGLLRVSAAVPWASPLSVLLRLAAAEAKKKHKKRRKKKRKKCKGKQKCGGKCIPKSACCTDADCDGEESCCAGQCTAPVYCDGVVTCGCDEVCRTGDGEVECLAGGCPAGADICRDAVTYFCGGTIGCRCQTSIEGETVCADFGASVCFQCATDAQCTEELGRPAICIDMVGSACSCGMDSTTACFPTGCPNDVAGRAKARSSQLRLDRPALGR